jgi:hypothetical protein
MPSRDELPVPDHDRLPVGSLARRIRALDAAAVDVLVAYENEHAARRPVLDQLFARREVPSGDEAGTNQPLRHSVAGRTPNRQIRSG